MLVRARSRDVVLVADDGKRLLGFIAVWVGTGQAYIDNLHIQPALRGQGIGEQLMRAAARRLVRIGHRQADLWAFVANTAALQHVVWPRLERLAR